MYLVRPGLALVWNNTDPQSPLKWNIPGSQETGSRFSKAPESFRARKAIAKYRTLRVQSCFSRIF